MNPIEDPALDPRRILEDRQLGTLLGAHSTPAQRIHLMAHFDHPRELSDPTRRGRVLVYRRAAAARRLDALHVAGPG